MNSALHPPAKVGIEKISAYPCSMVLDLGDLARARGDDPHYPERELLTCERAVNPLWEDPVTMAVNAAQSMLSEEDRRSIELLIVGTESSWDQSKPISTFVHRWLGIQPNCRNFEIKHACYGGTAALMMAAHWVASGAAPGKKALVLTADQSRANLGESFEYVMGAGATALLVSADPRVLELDLGSHGYWTQEVGDTFRPTSKEEAGNTSQSLYCYLEGLDGALDHFLERTGEGDLDAAYAKHIYHVPFGGLTLRAHAALLRRRGRITHDEAKASFERKSKAALRYTSRLGGTYTSATFLALLGLLDGSDDLIPGLPITIFSYGSGSCAEMYRAKIGNDALAVARAARMQERCDRRHRLSVAEYEAVERARTAAVDAANLVPDTRSPQGVYAELYAGQRYLVLDRIDGHFRHYRWS